ncbi:Ig-like domain-containing protein [Pseudoalteromonas aurantia]|uniref:Uncharacterized protein n=1 Tax=Pseudoalteromonas aurantia 208 TaxID=1314867 RepID=A0ABR9EH97_9GAMM|nr:hypothetical protein [Pseudoalteromonas aurantia]MBE0370364.1 hypothetical protein [Pseudoalteromonas aurantia 208]
MHFKIINFFILFLSFNVISKPLAPFISGGYEYEYNTVSRVSIVKVTGASSYKVFFNGDFIGSTTQDTYDYFVPWQKKGDGYFEVQACNESGCSGFSNKLLIHVYPKLYEPIQFDTPRALYTDENFCVDFPMMPYGKNYHPYLQGKMKGSTRGGTQCYTLDRLGSHAYHVKNNFTSFSAVHTIQSILRFRSSDNPQIPELSAPKSTFFRSAFDLTISPVNGAVRYEVYENDALLLSTANNSVLIRPIGYSPITRSLKVRACTEFTCYPFSNEIQIALVDLGPVNVQAPLLAVEGESTCINYEKVNNANRYYFKFRGAGSGTRIGTFHCITPKKPGELGFTITACSSVSCSSESAIISMYVLPKPSLDYNIAMSLSENNIVLGDEVSITYSAPTSTVGNTYYQLFSNDNFVAQNKGSTFTYTPVKVGLESLSIAMCNDRGCNKSSALSKLTVNPPPVVLAPLPKVTLINSKITLAWLQNYESAQYSIIHYGPNNLKRNYLVTPGNKLFDIKDSSKEGEVCFVVIWKENSLSGRSNPVCTLIRAQNTIKSQNTAPHILIQNESFTLAKDLFTFNYNRHMLPFKIEAGENYILSDDKLTLTPLPGYFGEIMAPVIFKDSYGVQSKPYIYKLNIIDGRPITMGDETYKIEYGAAPIWIAPYKLGQADPRGLEIVSTKITWYAEYGQLNVTHEGKIIQYKSVASNCQKESTFIDTFAYTITNSAGLESRPATVKILTRCPYSPEPVAIGDVYQYQKNKPLVANVIDNSCNDGYPKGAILPKRCVPDDYDPYGRKIHMGEITQSPHSGTIVNTYHNGEVLYVPNKDSCVVDWFKYTIVNDTGLKSAPRLVRLDCGTYAPNAESDQVILGSGQEVIIPILSNDTDLNTPALDISAHEIITLPKYGEVSISTDKQSAIYKHDNDSCIRTGLQQDKFEYQIINTQGAVSPPATVKVNTYCHSLAWQSQILELGLSNEFSWALPEGFGCYSPELDKNIVGEGTLTHSFIEEKTYSITWHCKNSALNFSFDKEHLIKVEKEEVIAINIDVPKRVFKQAESTINWHFKSIPKQLFYTTLSVKPPGGSALIALSTVMNNGSGQFAYTFNSPGRYEFYVHACKSSITQVGQVQPCRGLNETSVVVETLDYVFSFEKVGSKYTWTPVHLAMNYDLQKCEANCQLSSNWKQFKVYDRDVTSFKGTMTDSGIYRIRVCFSEGACSGWYSLKEVVPAFALQLANNSFINSIDNIGWTYNTKNTEKYAFSLYVKPPNGKKLEMLIDNVLEKTGTIKYRYASYGLYSFNAKLCSVEVGATRGLEKCSEISDYEVQVHNTKFKLSKSPSALEWSPVSDAEKFVIESALCNEECTSNINLDWNELIILSGSVTSHVLAEGVKRAYRIKTCFSNGTCTAWSYFSNKNKDVLFIHTDILGSSVAETMM